MLSVANVPGLAQRWRFKTGPHATSPAVVDGTVYVGSYDGYLYAVNASTGKERWHTIAPDGPVDSSPAVAGGRVFVGSNENIYAFDAATGAQIWDVPSPVNVTSSPVVANGVVYIGPTTEDHASIAALDPDTGEILWSHQLTAPARSSVAVVNGTVYMGSDDHHLYAFALPD